jgi:hypothetical protein
MASSKKGINVHQLHRTLKVAYVTAWFMEHRLREVMREPNFAQGYKRKTTKTSETYVDSKKRSTHRNERPSKKPSAPKKKQR